MASFGGGGGGPPGGGRGRGRGGPRGGGGPPGRGGPGGGPGGDRGFGTGFRGRGSRGNRGGGRGFRRRGRRGDRDKQWIPKTKLGRLVLDGKFPTLESIFQFSIKIKEPEIIDHFFKRGEEDSEPLLRDEIMKIKPVQKQTSAGQRTRFKAWVAVGDGKHHVGLGQKCAAEVGIAIKGAHTLAKLSLVPVRKGYWGSRLGEPHTVPCKVTGKCGSARVRIIPAPRGTGLVAAPATKQVLQMAGIHDIFSVSRGQTRTTGNFITAMYLALRKTYKIVTPDMWGPRRIRPNPLDVFPAKIIAD